jgi:uncharacterized protein
MGCSAGNSRLSLGLTRSGWQTWGLALLLPLPILAVSYGLAWVSGAAAFAAPTESGWLPESPDQSGNQFSYHHPLRGIGRDWFSRLSAAPAAATGRYTGDPPFRLFAWRVAPAPHLLTPFYLAEGNRWLTIPLFLLLLTAAGAIYGALRLATGSLVASVILHASFQRFSRSCSLR